MFLLPLNIKYSIYNQNIINNKSFVYTHMHTEMVYILCDGGQPYSKRKHPHYTSSHTDLLYSIYLQSQ